MTLTATFQPATATMEVLSPPGSQLRYRTDNNGTRLLTRLKLRADAPANTWVDHEGALSGLVSYTFIDTATLAESTATVAIPEGSAGPRIHAITAPSLVIAPRLLTTNYDASTDTGATVHRPINRPSPIIVSSPARTREGSLEVWCADHSEARAAARIVQGGDGVMMLRSPEHDGVDMYFSALRVAVRPAEHAARGLRWMAQISYIELDHPSTVAQTTRTFDDLLEVGNFLTVATTHRDFLDAESGGNL